ncbi:MAG TPA: alkylhydroperoxidase [Cryomorphaceae bacterium]|nr:alkylhydroperoxidase [Owenweeksia sp.]MBF98407.1 alkylhydroperoxidase [Owenweeksia sp.]HAD96231.1 alkylhydroperoxidase [Cryomorphaceae bacterium]HBF18908.1 alkylhydroperoxidase [Cryomorphaceae bacterium]HCQ17534.1 alkylhydroperoxidase [Cryomorphaceae bacterium]|tara:strand:+ start:688 stop:1269 length:582 start_codon:yes stop_codon:yes gene_type:complete
MNDYLREYLYAPVSYDQASPEVREIYDDTKRTLQLPFVLNWFKYQGGNVNLLKANWEKLKRTLMDGEVPNVLKQLIIYNVSQERGCSYCAHAHGVFANSMSDSISGDIDFKLTENMDSNLIPNSYKVAIKVVTKAALRPEEIDEGDFVAMREAGFNDQEIKELFAQADLVNMLNTIAYVTNVKIDNELMEAQF